MRRRYSSCLCLPLAFALFSLSAARLIAVPPPLGYFAPAVNFEAGALFGLDEAPRGGKAGLGFAFARIPLAPAFRIAVVGDRGLSTWLIEASLAFGLGGDIAMFMGILHPLGEASLSAESGSRLRLAPGFPPSLFGIEARVAERRISAIANLSVVAAMEYGAWRISGMEAGAKSIGFASTDALRVFLAGFDASLLLSLDLGSPRRAEFPASP